MPNVFEVVEGSTSPIPVQLVTRPHGGQFAVPDEPLDGSFVAIITDSDGISIVATGEVEITDAALWKIRYTPAAGDFEEGVYRLRFELTTDEDIVYFPSGQGDTLRVFPM